MEEKVKQNQKWWHKQLAVKPVIIVASVLVTTLIIVIVLGYLFKLDWTGLNATDVTSPPQNIIVYQPGKTLWDWLQLLFVPAVLTLGAVWITARQNHDLQIADQQRRSERELAEDKYRENTLQDYLDKISELLLKEHLGELTEEGKLKPKYEQVRKIARVRTLTALHRLDGWRKGGVLQFLYESGLIFKSGLIQNSETIIRLYFADLSGANLHGVSLGGAELSQTNLKGADLSDAYLTKAALVITDLIEANLSGANLSEADLSQTNLKGADLTGANLKGVSGFTKIEEQLKQAKSLKGATMPDGSIHP